MSSIGRKPALIQPAQPRAFHRTIPIKISGYTYFKQALPFLLSHEAYKKQMSEDNEEDLAVACADADGDASDALNAAGNC
jgi:hypothetical protein